MIPVLCVLGLLALILAAAYGCYRMAFTVPPLPKEDAPLPPGPQYDAVHSEMQALVRAAQAVPFEDVWTTSEDGLRLHGKYYHFADGAPVQLMFHGYRSYSALDFCGALPAARRAGYNALLVDQRAQGQSGGRCLSFGIKERYDCLSWLRYVSERFGDVKVVLCGLSMGAATVLMATALPLRSNVSGVISDCAYSAPAEIIRKVIRDRHCPQWPVYPLVRLGGRLFGGFDIEEASALEAMRTCTVPVLFLHGEDDRFVPCEMARALYQQCAAKQKTLLTIPDAGHGLSFMVDERAYSAAVSDFLNSVL